MKIGILGCGNMGATLGQYWAKVGHEVWFASGEVEKATQLAQEHGGNCATYPEVIERSSVLLYTIRHLKPQELSPRGWSGKTVIDCNQPELLPGFEFVARNYCLAQQLATCLPLCQVVKAFCLHPVELYHHGAEQLRSWGVQTFFCGDSPADKEIVSQLAVDLGLLPFDCGSLARAYLLESQADFWRLFQLQQGQQLVSQFQLVGYPEPAHFSRQPGRF